MSFFVEDADWTGRCSSLLAEIGTRFAGLGVQPDDFGLVALQERGPALAPVGFHYRGDWLCYPCSLVKVFHLVHALSAIDAGLIADHDELSRAMRDMILWSSNTATNYVIDIITGTTGDTLLESEAFQAWAERREGLNRFFRSLNWSEFDGCNLTQKLMDDVRYGREAQFAGPSGEYLNALTPLANARLFHAIFCGHLGLSDAASQRARAILARDRSAPGADLPQYQLREYLGEGLPADARIWSKAGHNMWTGDPRSSYFKHDLIRFELPGSMSVIVCLMTRGESVSVSHPEVFGQIGSMVAHWLAYKTDTPTRVP